MKNDSGAGNAFRAMIFDADFPCVGAKSALGKGQLALFSAREIRSAWDDGALHDALMRFAWDYRAAPTLFRSFAVIFDGPTDLDEVNFEKALWARAQSLSDKDVWPGQEPDPRVSDDPANSHFSLSFGGEAFFVVGLHPDASRPARRFVKPVLVFNLHAQFEELRRQDRYEKLRSAIMARDLAVTGTHNPMLARYGTSSEARQYSGRLVPESWRCPFSRAEAKPSDHLLESEA